MIQWTEEDDQKLFKLYKEKGSCWSQIANEFPGLNENQVKNRFYSTLRRLATKKALNDSSGEKCPKTKKKDLIEFVDDAIMYGHNCRSKRGRKKKVKTPEASENQIKERINYYDNNEEDEINDALIEEPVISLKGGHNEINFIEEEKGIGFQEAIIKETSFNEDFCEINNKSSYDTVKHIESSEYITLLLMQNEGILNEFQEVTKEDNTYNDLEELLELEREMEKRLKATQEALLCEEDKGYNQ